MKRRLLSVLVLYCFLASSLMATSSETETHLITQSELDSMSSLVSSLTQQRDYYKTELTKQRKLLTDLSVYQQNLETLSGISRSLTQSEKDWIQSAQKSIVELEQKLSEVSNQLTQAQLDLKTLKDLKSQQDKLYQDSLKDLEAQKTKTTFWQWVSGIASALAFALGGYLGITLF